MEHSQTHTALSRINEAFHDEQYDRSLSLSRSLKRRLLDSDDPCDPMELGWARFYEFKSLYELGEYRQAYDLLERPESRAYAVPQKNAAYMFSVGSELAMHLGLAAEVVCWGERCLETRMDAGDRIGAVQCANTVCVLLGRMQRDDLNARFARYLIAIGKETGAERPLIAGYRFLAANVALSSDPMLMVEAAAGVEALTAIRDDRFSGEAIEALGAIAHAPWYVHALAPAARRRHIVERALLEAADSGELDAVRDLVEAGTDVDATDVYGRTALMKAAMKGLDRVVDVLLERGADPTATDRTRMTAADWAAQEGFDALAAGLRQAARRWR